MPNPSGISLIIQKSSSWPHQAAAFLFSNVLSLLFHLRVKSLQWCLTLCDPTDCSPPGSSVHGILQAKLLERVAMKGTLLTQEPNPSLMSLVLAGGFFTTSPTWEAPSFIYSTLMLVFFLTGLPLETVQIGKRTVAPFPSHSTPDPSTSQDPSL